MSPHPPAATVPARVTLRELASVLGRTVEEVAARLVEEGEHLLPDDHLDADTSLRLARSFSVPLAVEPRDLALELLYQVETGGQALDPATLKGRVGFLYTGVLDHREELDAEIEAASQHWSIARMPIIDRSILRLGLLELERSPETPTAVVVSEAVRLAHTYSTERSGAFVNGVLAALARTVRQ